MIVHELSFPAAWENNVQAGYGGNQEWFSRVFQRMAGCASVAGVNLATYHVSRTAEDRSLYSGDTGQFSKSEYLRVIEEMYRYMTPGPMGLPAVGRSVQKFLQLAGEHGSTLRVYAMFRRCGHEEQMTFLKEVIVKGSLMAFLVPRHRAPEMKGNNWYWVTIIGWIGDVGGKQVTVSNCGERGVYQVKMLLESHRGNVLRMVWFFR